MDRPINKKSKQHIEASIIVFVRTQTTSIIFFCCGIQYLSSGIAVTFIECANILVAFAKTLSIAEKQLVCRPLPLHNNFGLCVCVCLCRITVIQTLLRSLKCKAKTQKQQRQNADEQITRRS